MNDSILVLAGEPSGDMQAAELIKSIQNIDDSISFWGLGGDLCQETGMEIISHVNDLALMGFIEVLPAIPRLKRLQRNLIRLCRERKPKAAIFIDYPGFNLSIAPRIKKLGIKTIYFISPQFWAWHESRVKKIRKYFDKMIVILPFEKDFYKKHGIEADYVGHPFIDIVQPTLSEDEFLDRHGLDKDYILLMPGSRKQEISRHLPLMLDVAASFPEHKWAFLKSPGISADYISRFFERGVSGVKIVGGDNYSAMKYAYFALVGSGSATLECAVSGTAFFVIYKTSTLSYLIAKSMVLVDCIGLVNLVAGEKIVPEFIQSEASFENIRLHLNDIFENKDKYLHLKDKIKSIREKLGDGGSSDKAAKIILNTLEGNQVSNRL